MAHFAELDDNNIVKQVIVVHNNELLDSGVESEQRGIDFCTNLLGGRWIQTSYNHSIRQNFAGPGSLYDPIRNAFIAPQPTTQVIKHEISVSSKDTFSDSFARELNRDSSLVSQWAERAPSDLTTPQSANK